MGNIILNDIEKKLNKDARIITVNLHQKQNTNTFYLNNCNPF